MKTKCMLLLMQEPRPGMPESLFLVLFGFQWRRAFS